MEALFRSTRGSRLVPYNRLVINSGAFVNPREVTGLERKEIEELADSILRNEGLLVPPVVRRTVDDATGEFIDLVLDGQRRCAALGVLVERGKIKEDVGIWVNDREELEENESLVVPVNGIADESIGDALEIGTRRAGLSSYEQIKAAATLAERHKQIDVATRIGRSEAWVSRMVRAWNAATEDLREALRRGEITDEQFKDLAKVPVAHQEEAVTETVETRKKDKAKANAVAKARAGIPPKPRKEPEQRAVAPPAPEPILYNIEPIIEGRSSRPRALDDRIDQALDLLGLAEVRPPVLSYVKGVIAAVRFLTGEDGFLESGEFKQWVKDAKDSMDIEESDPDARRGRPRVRHPAEDHELDTLDDSPATPSPAPAPAPSPTPDDGRSKGCRARHHSRCAEPGCTCSCHHKE